MGSTREHAKWLQQFEPALESFDLDVLSQGMANPTHPRAPLWMSAPALHPVPRTAAKSTWPNRRVRGADPGRVLASRQGPSISRSSHSSAPNSSSRSRRGRRPKKMFRDAADTRMPTLERSHRRKNSTSPKIAPVHCRPPPLQPLVNPTNPSLVTPTAPPHPLSPPPPPNLLPQRATLLSLSLSPTTPFSHHPFSPRPPPHPRRACAVVSTSVTRTSPPSRVESRSITLSSSVYCAGIGSCEPKSEALQRFRRERRLGCRRSRRRWSKRRWSRRHWSRRRWSRRRCTSSTRSSTRSRGTK